MGDNSEMGDTGDMGNMDDMGNMADMGDIRYIRYLIVPLEKEQSCL